MWGKARDSTVFRSMDMSHYNYTMSGLVLLAKRARNAVLLLVVALLSMVLAVLITTPVAGGNENYACFWVALTTQRREVRHAPRVVARPPPAFGLEDTLGASIVPFSVLGDAAPVHLSDIDVHFQTFNPSASRLSSSIGGFDVLYTT